jgi:hypothetical protein
MTPFRKNSPLSSGYKYPEDGGIIFVWNVDNHLLYTVTLARRPQYEL